MSREQVLGRHRGGRSRRLGRPFTSLAPRPGQPGAGTFGWLPVWLVMLPVYAVGGAVMYGVGYGVTHLLGGTFDAMIVPIWASGMWLANGVASTVVTLRGGSRAQR